MGRKLLWASLALTPVALAARYGFHASPTLQFVFSALALVPLAWLIGESTEHAAEHVGPGMGGFLNASFGNAPELIIALIAINNGLPDVVRGSITGSVVSNMLLVLGFAIVAGDGGSVDRRSLWLQLGGVGAATVLLLVPSVPGWHGSPERHSLYVVTIAVAAILLVAYVATTAYNLRLHREAPRQEPGAGSWRLGVALAVLAGATLATAFVSESLVHSLDAFGHAVGLDQFFIAAVIIAIVGNAAEHGGAVVIARKGNLPLASEIAVTSSLQVLLLVAPAVALLSWLVGPSLPLAFRPVEIGCLAAGVVAAGVVVSHGRTGRAAGWILIVVYAACAAGFYLSGDRVG